MSEQDAAPVEDTPTPEAPVEDTPLVDYEARYNNLRPEFDRRSQQLREYEERLAAYEQAQQEPEDDYEDFEYEDQVARQEIAQLKALLSKQQEDTRKQQEAEQERKFIENNIELLEKEQEEEFSDDEFEALGIFAERYRDEEGKPDIARAYEHLFGKIVKPRREKYVSTKKASRPRSGAAAAQSIDLDDPKARREYMTQKLVELEGHND